MLLAAPTLARVKVSATLASWLRAWRTGLIERADVMAHVEASLTELIGHDHMVIDGEMLDADGTDELRATPLNLALEEFVHATADQIQLVLPAPGDIRGLPSSNANSPPALRQFVALAMDTGCALLYTAAEENPIRDNPTAFGLVVEPLATRMVAWHRFALPVSDPAPLPGTAIELPSWAIPPRDPATPADTDSSLIEELHEATAILDRLDLAPDTTGRTEALAELRRMGTHGVELPPGYSQRDRLRLARAGMVLGITEIAAGDHDGGAVDSHQTVERDRALRRISAAARRAYAATVNVRLDTSGLTASAPVTPSVL